MDDHQISSGFNINMNDYIHYYEAEELDKWRPLHYIPNSGTPKMQLQAAFINRKTKYALKLSMDSESCNERMMGIVCKIEWSYAFPVPLGYDNMQTDKAIDKGLSMVNSKAVFLLMIEEGMTIAKVGASIGVEEDVRGLVRFVRNGANEYSAVVGVPNYPLAVALETSGPDVYTGDNEEGPISMIEVHINDSVTLTNNPDFEFKCSKEHIFITYPDLVNVLEPGDKVHLFGGFVVLEVTGIESATGNVVCKAVRDGKFPSRVKVSLPLKAVTWETLSPKDKEDIQLALEENVDFLFVSFTRNAATINEARQLLGEDGKYILIIASIEDEEGVNNIDEIIQVADGIQISRPSLSVRLDPLQTFSCEKLIINKCFEADKPVIVAGMTLCTMSYCDSIPSEAEPSDEEECYVSGLVLEGVDAVALEDETFTGRYPTVCLKKIVEISKATDGAMWQPHLIARAKKELELSKDPVLHFLYAAVELSHAAVASLIVVANCSSSSVPLIAHFRPRVPIVAVTRESSVARQLQLHRGVFPVQYSDPLQMSWDAELDARKQYGMTYGKCRGIIRNGEWVIVLKGCRPHLRYANSMSLFFAYDKWLNYALKRPC